MEGKPVLGILDTGVVVLVLCYKHWPKHWDLEKTSRLQGIGQASPQQRAKILKWQDNEGHEGREKYIAQQKIN